MAAQKTTFVVDADIRSAARSLDEIAAKEEKVAAGFRKIGNDASAMEIKVSAANRKVAEAVQGPRVTTGGGYVAAPSRSMAYDIAPAVAVSAVARVAGAIGGYGRPGGHVVGADGGNGSFGYSVAGEDPLAYGAGVIGRMGQVTPIKTTAANDPHAARLAAAAIAQKVAAESRASTSARHSAAANLDVQLFEANYAREQREIAEKMHVSQRAHSIAQQVSAEARSKMAARASAKEDDANQWEVTKFEQDYQRRSAGAQRQRERNRAGWQMLGVASVGAAAYVANEAVNAHEANRDRVLSFNNDFRKVASLGDNIGKIGKKRSEVLNLSTAYGVSTEQVNAAMYDIQSAASDLSPKEQKELIQAGLSFNRLQGSDAGTAAKAVLKYKQGYGLESVAQARDRMALVSDLGDIEIDKLATLAPEYLAQAKAVGIKDTYAMAAMIPATAKLGRNETTLTGLAGFFKDLPKNASNALGIELKGTVEDLDKLAKFDGKRLLDAFGDQVGVARALIDSREQIKLYEQQLKAVGATSDIVGEKLKKMWGDSALKYSETMAQIKEAKNNMPLTADWQKDWGKADLELNYRELGYQSKLGPVFGNMGAKPMAMHRSGVDALYDYGVESSFINPLGWAALYSAAPLKLGYEVLDWFTGDPAKQGKQVIQKAQEAAGRQDVSDEAAKDLNKASKNIATYSRGAFRVNAHVE